MSVLESTPRNRVSWSSIVNLVYHQPFTSIVKMQKKKKRERKKGKGKHLPHKDLSIMLTVALSTGSPLGLEVSRRTKVVWRGSFWFAPARFHHVSWEYWACKAIRGDMDSVAPGIRESRRDRERSGPGKPVASIKNLKTNSLWRNARLDSSEAGSSSCGCN